MATVPSLIYFGLENKADQPGIVKFPIVISDLDNHKKAKIIKSIKITFSSKLILPNALYCCLNDSESILIQLAFAGLYKKYK